MSPDQGRTATKYPSSPQPAQVLAEIATRFDKYALTYLGGVTLAAMVTTYHRVALSRHDLAS
jgi:hypothetical protein